MAQIRMNMRNLRYQYLGRNLTTSRQPNQRYAIRNKNKTLKRTSEQTLTLWKQN